MPINKKKKCFSLKRFYSHFVCWSSLVSPLIRDNWKDENLSFQVSIDDVFDTEILNLNFQPRGSQSVGIDCEIEKNSKWHSKSRNRAKDTNRSLAYSLPTDEKKSWSRIDGMFRQHSIQLRVQRFAAEKLIHQNWNCRFRETRERRVRHRIALTSFNLLFWIAYYFIFWPIYLLPANDGHTVYAVFISDDSVCV